MKGRWCNTDSQKGNAVKIQRVERLPPLTFDAIDNDNVIFPLDMVNNTDDIATDETEINKDDTAAVAHMMMEMGQVVDV